MRNSPAAAIAAALALAASAAGPASEARAQEQAERVEEIVVVGSRRTGRAVTESPAPVDVLPAEDLAEQGASDMTDVIRTLVPSYNVNTNPISDAAAFVRPPNLRGLAPDQMLVLLNGKRRHRSSVITFFGNGISDGAQGPDVSVFPAIALKRVEVLRDSASAQYGSDAIAGVLNFVLRDAPDGGAVEAQWGRTYEGDGDAYRLSANAGLPFGPSGFANVSAEWSGADPTVRSVQRADAQEEIDAGNTAVRQPYAQVWGEPRVSDDHKVFVNLGAGQTYLFANYAARQTEGGFFFRNPNPAKGPKGVYADDNEAALEGTLQDGSTWSVDDLYPGGFTPQFGGEIADTAMTIGLRDNLASGVAYDASLTWGESSIDYYIHNTLNPSLGPDSPTAFDAGSHIQTETTLNLDVSREFGGEAMSAPIYAAAGFEWREEQFRVRAGQPESWIEGDLNARQGNDEKFLIGSNGFAGFSDRVTGMWSRDNIALYLDLEGDPSPNLTLTGAARWEDFSDFGGTVNYKGGALYRMSPAVGLRGTVSTGFRAPNVAQQNITQEITDVSPSGLQQELLLPPTDPIAMKYGGKPLEPEESLTFSAGVVVDRNTVNFTVDYFRIDVDGRLGIREDVTPDSNDRMNLLGRGYSNVGKVKFFVNDFDTRTQGIDVTATFDATGKIPLMQGGTTEVVFAGNWTQTTVRRSSFIGQGDRILRIQNTLPKLRANLTARNHRGNWRWLARANYFGTYTMLHADESLIDMGEEFTFDLEAGYRTSERVEFVIGAENILNNYPDRNTHARDYGAEYPEYAPMGFAGGFYYARVRYEF